METQKYRASDMQEALAQINSELGPDAIIISSKLVRQNTGIRGLFEKRVYEVVAAYEVTSSRAPRFPENKQRPAKPAMKNEPLNNRKPLPAHATHATRVAQREMPSAAIKPASFERFIQGSMNDPVVEDRRQRIEAVAEDRRQRIEAVEAVKRDFAILGANTQHVDQFSEIAVRVPLPTIPLSLQLPDLKEQARIISLVDPVQAPEAVPLPPASTILAEPLPKTFAIPKPAANTFTTVKVSLPVPKGEDFLDADIDFKDNKEENTQLNGQRLGSEALDIRLDEIKEILQKVSDRFEYIKLDAKNGYSPKVEKLTTSLIFNAVNADIAHELARKTQQSVDQIQANPQNVMRKLLKGMLGEPNFIRCERGKRRSVMLIGPTGVGKTTTLAKLAAYYAIKLSMNVGIINSDVFRVAAQEQLSAYAEIMNIANITIHNSEDIKSALDKFKDKDIVFIDTSGKLASDSAYQRDIKTMIDVGEIDEVYLALCSTTSDRVCKEIINHYRFVENYKVIVTKIDENNCFGNIVNISKYSGRPLSYLTNGQNVPDDILQIDIDEMVEKVMR